MQHMQLEECLEAARRNVLEHRLTPPSALMEIASGYVGEAMPYSSIAGLMNTSEDNVIAFMEQLYGPQFYRNEDVLAMREPPCRNDVLLTHIVEGRIIKTIRTNIKVHEMRPTPARHAEGTYPLSIARRLLGLSYEEFIACGERKAVSVPKIHETLPFYITSGMILDVAREFVTSSMLANYRRMLRAPHEAQGTPDAVQ